MKPTCAVIVLNYNGRGLLSQFLESVVVAADSARVCHTRVIVLDNASTDDGIQWVQTHLRTVEIVSAPSNRFLYSYNWLAQVLDCELLLLLNNDIEMRPDCLDPLYDTLLYRPGTFSVTPQMYQMDRITINSGYWTGRFSKGELDISLGGPVDTLTPTVFGSGGALLLRRREFLSLGGFDKLYYPAYWEDIDLCYRAWKRDMRSYCQPDSVMYHVHSASTKHNVSFQSKRVRMIDRNRWLFVWRNIAERRILIFNMYWTAIHCASLIRRREWEILETYQEALRHWKRALAGRPHAEQGRVLSDAQIIDAVKP